MSKRLTNVARHIGKLKFVNPLDTAQELAQCAAIKKSLMSCPCVQPRRVQTLSTTGEYTVHKGLCGHSNRQALAIFDSRSVIEAARFSDMLHLYFWPWNERKEGATEPTGFNFSLARAKQDLELEKAFLGGLIAIKNTLVEFYVIPEHPSPRAVCGGRPLTRRATMQTLFEDNARRFTERLDAFEKLSKGDYSTTFSRISELEERIAALEKHNAELEKHKAEAVAAEFDARLNAIISAGLK